VCSVPNLFGARVFSSQPVESPGSHEYGRGTTITIAPVESIIDIEGVRALFRRYGESLSFSLAYQSFEGELAGLPAPYVPPHGSKRLSVGIAEAKRLYVVPEARGRGIGKMLLTRIIDVAWEKGYERIRLDSHRSSMATAITMYRSLGFVEIPPYGADLGGEIAFFEKCLHDAASK
jgi:GNAT superfamily N-acetyltransferase